MKAESVRRPRIIGFTLVEVLIAIAVLGIVLAAVSITMLSSIRQNHTAGNRSQAAQIMNYLGRRIAGLPTRRHFLVLWHLGDVVYRS